MPKKLKILSWNINGLRAAASHGLGAVLASQSPDIIGLQEIKVSNEARTKVEFDFPKVEEFFNPAKRPGYAGTATFTKEKPLKYWIGWGEKSEDEEGRVQTLEFEKFYFVNCYFPNSNHELSRLPFKQEFNKNFLAYIKKLDKKKPVIATGDYNVAHEEIDLARPKDNVGNPGFTDEERKDFAKFVSAGFSDTFRKLNGNKVQYSWWSQRSMARARNVGWRIDYFLVSERFLKNVNKAYILDEALGSDHAPVGIEIET